MFTLTNAHGIELHGASPTAASSRRSRCPIAPGKLADIVLGFDRLDGYLADPPPPFFGAIIGRYGNRIAKGQFTLDGKTYTLATNNGAEPSARRQQGLRQGALERREPLQRRQAPA